jgi:hypothetical protein
MYIVIMVSLAAIALIVFDVAGDISLVIHPLLHRKYAYTFQAFYRYFHAFLAVTRRRWKDI